MRPGKGRGERPSRRTPDMEQSRADLGSRAQGMAREAGPLLWFCSAGLSQGAQHRGWEWGGAGGGVSTAGHF